MKLMYRILALLALGALDSIRAHSSKIDATLQNSLQRNGHANILVSMEDGTQDVLDKLNNMSFSSRTERIQALYDALTSQAQQSQSKLLHLLSTQSISEKFKFVNVESLWITNQLFIEYASVDFVGYLASMEEISKIHEDEIVHLRKPVDGSGDQPAVTANQWGITKTQTPQAWALFDGSFVPNNIIVANIDSGVRYTHEILNPSYKNNNYSWFDAVLGSATPYDDYGHGTHTMGILIGSNGYGVATTNSIKWSACKAMGATGSGTFANILRCGQWVVCPTTPNNSTYNCSQAPHVVSNSYNVGVGANSYFDGMIAAWHTARIIPVFSIGNAGTQCGTVRSPGDRDVIGVGSTASDESLSVTSSVGPGSTYSQKPDISAPGTDVTSASWQGDNLYFSLTGTSMACPHVAGTVALMLSKNKNLTYSQVKTLLEENTDQNLTSGGKTCSGKADNVFPNYQFGHGRLNVYKAVLAA